MDDQLFGTFSRCHETLRQPPIQAESRDHLRQLLSVSSGGVIFTTIQKFSDSGDGQEELTDRRNVIVIADEAHRSQYDFIDGFARHMRDALPGASFIGFTGTPIEKTDASTTAVFGDTISVYDIQRAVEDGATVPIYYENRLVKLNLDEELKPALDSGFEEATETEELTNRERLRTRWAAIEAIVGTEKRIKAIAKDLVTHFEERQQGMVGKGLIVGMSRRICVDLYREIVALRPEWHGNEDSDGAIKIVMTGSATDPLEWQQHIRNKQRREGIGERFKKPSDPLKLVIVRDMWLTGFDVPCLHTMYIDKYMHAHGLMQAIARVNRVFRDKPGGLVVDYLGIAQELKKALSAYTEGGGQVIEELIALAKGLREAGRRGESLGLNDDELAFYDALEVNESAVQVLGDASLRMIARELVENVRKNISLDWTQKENVQAKLRVIVKRILKKHGYPPDMQERATQTVLEQAEVLSENWSTLG